MPVVAPGDSEVPPVNTLSGATTVTSTTSKYSTATVQESVPPLSQLAGQNGPTQDNPPYDNEGGVPSDLTPNSTVNVTDFLSIPLVLIPEAQFQESAGVDNSVFYTATDWGEV